MNIQDKTEVRALIEGACKELNFAGVTMNSPEAIELLIGTWAVESNGGQYTKQLGGGPALSAWQIEKATFYDIIRRCWKSHREVLSVSAGVSNIMTDDFPKIENNHKLAVQVARLKYFLCPAKIPTDLTGQARYWKTVYNTKYGKGTIEDYLTKYQKYVKN